MKERNSRSSFGPRGSLFLSASSKQNETTFNPLAVGKDLNKNELKSALNSINFQCFQQFLSIIIEYSRVQSLIINKYTFSLLKYFKL